MSGTALCPPGGADCFTSLVDANSVPARVSASSPVIVQTGQFPSVGPGLPVSLLTGSGGDIAGTGGQQGYHWRVLDQNGQVLTADTRVFFHASAPFTDAGRTAREAIVFTDAGGNARVTFNGTLAATPVAVIATGRSPYTGPGLPVNLVTSGYSRTGFTVRALDQAGHPIVSRGIRIHYWATNQGATPSTRAGQATLTPDANGRATIPWTIFAKGLPAVSVVLTGTSPLTGPSMPVNLLAVTARSDGVAIRVLDQSGRPVTSPVRIAYYATKAAASVS
ncbi:MAG TPA: hypothetical protein VI357_26145 [Mycobacteriales bacterium]